MSILAKADTDFAHNGFQAIVPGNSQQVTTTGTSQVISLQPATTLIRVQCTEDCFLKRGPSPVANTTTSLFLKGQTVEYFGVLEGDSLAVIESSTGGTLYLDEAI